LVFATLLQGVCGRSRHGDDEGEVVDLQGVDEAGLEFYVFGADVAYVGARSGELAARSST